MKKILILPEYWSKDFIGACGWIRLLEPLFDQKILNNFNVDYSYSIDEYKRIPDIVIFERLWHPKEINFNLLISTLEKLKSKGCKIIYSIDDNLIDYPFFQKSNWYNSIYLSVINAFFYYSDLIIVSTQELKVRFSDYNKNIVVIPNAINTNKIRKKDQYTKNDKLTFGYLMSPDNIDYLYGILEPLKTVLNEYNGKVDFEIMGHPNAYLTSDIFKNLSVKFMPPPDTAYKKYIQWLYDNCFWDFGIAPINKNNFTKCKSDMKFLDFTRLSIPGIYTNFTPYDQVYENKTGLVVNEDWTESLISMIENTDLREELLTSALEYTIKNRSLNNQVAQWNLILNNL